MNDVNLPEVWLRGPITGVPALLQPVAHALLQSQQEINELLANFPDELLWIKPGGMASVAFHLQHIAGVIDRMTSYAKQLPLNEKQLAWLEGEGKFDRGISKADLISAFNKSVHQALKELEHTDVNTLTDYRPVGRKKLPSTVAGLLFHMGEHTMRHTGQLLVTVKLLQTGL